MNILIDNSVWQRLTKPGVVHYDKNYATIARVDPHFRQRWITPPGTID